jgi:transcriptional regulator with XRE-family HTH domain
MRTRGMSKKPTLKQLVAATGLSKGYAHDILSGRQSPSLKAAAHIFTRTRWKHESVEKFSDEVLEGIASADPWQVAA